MARRNPEEKQLELSQLTLLFVLIKDYPVQTQELKSRKHETERGLSWGSRSEMMGLGSSDGRLKLVVN